MKINWNDIQAVIFDMDGVLVDTEPIHVQAELLTCRYFSISVPLEEWENFKGKTAHSIAEYILRNYSAILTTTPDDFVNRKTEHFLRLASENVNPIKGAREFILVARKLFTFLALTTSSKKVIQELVFRKLSLHGAFDVIVTAEEVSVGKPHPEPYLITLRKLELKSKQCIVIEDSSNGIISAVGAGCLAIGIATSCRREILRKAGAIITVDNFSELQELVMREVQNA